MPATLPILIAGAGVAGLSAALALAGTGRPSLVLERSARLDEVGAGLQLSPNATRMLRAWGVLDRLDGVAVRPRAVVLRRAEDGREVAALPLAGRAEARWGAPYLTLHRADLQAALLAAVGGDAAVTLRLGAPVERVDETADGIWAVTGADSLRGRLMIAADGVRSAVRAQKVPATTARPSGYIAWRTTIAADDAVIAGAGLDAGVVTTFLHASIHLVAYPIRGGRAFNLVAIESLADAKDGFPARLSATAAGFAPFGQVRDWLAWPLNAVGPAPVFHAGGLVAFAGDAAHAVTPFAAQGAVMAIEDAAVLARMIAAVGAVPAALEAYADARAPRLARVARRGAFNHFAWHAAGPVALARDLVFRLAGGERLIDGLDWLYGFDAAA